MSDETRYLIQQLADFVAGLRYKDISFKEIEYAKKCVIDALGNMIYGRYSRMGEQIMAFSKATRIKPVYEAEVTILGEEEIFAKETAIFAHAVMARSSDLDDGSRVAMGHPGAVLVPLALTMAELYRSSGKELITALIAGYDVYIRLGEALSPYMYRERGIEPTGVCGAIAAAAVAGKIMGETAEQLKNAMGIASLFAGSLIEYQNDGTSGKVLCCGWAALNGLRAAELALYSFTGPNEAIEGKSGFLQAFRGSKMDPEKIAKGLGSDFRISEVYFKKHACMRGMHAAVDALLWLRAQYGLTIENVASIDIYTTEFLKRLSNPAPQTTIGAQCSIEFVLATALKHGHLHSEETVTKSLNDEQVLGLAKNIDIIKDKEIEEYLKTNPTHWTAVKLRICKHDGTQYEKWNPTPEGDIENPFDYGTLCEKFKRMTRATAFGTAATRLCRDVGALENLDHIESLMRA
jgi:2-methylcitrate dehydratase PrpD